MASDLFGNPEGLTPKEMADKYHLCQNVPYWQGRLEVEEWMQARRDGEAIFFARVSVQV